MKINCLSCGHTLELADAYSDYSGPFKCFVCRTFLEIKTRDGKVKSIRLPTPPPHPQALEASQ